MGRGPREKQGVLGRELESIARSVLRGFRVGVSPCSPFKAASWEEEEQGQVGITDMPDAAPGRPGFRLLRSLRSPGMRDPAGGCPGQATDSQLTTQQTKTHSRQVQPGRRACVRASVRLCVRARALAWLWLLWTVCTLARDRWFSLL